MLDATSAKAQNFHWRISAGEWCSRRVGDLGSSLTTRLLPVPSQGTAWCEEKG